VVSEDEFGLELLFLMKQQRNLYHQLRSLSEKQSQHSLTESPEIILQIITGRRKLIHKIREIEEKLSPIKSNWSNIREKIHAAHKAELREMANHIGESARDIRSFTSDIEASLDLDQAEKMTEMFDER